MSGDGAPTPLVLSRLRAEREASAELHRRSADAQARARAALSESRRLLNIRRRDGRRTTTILLYLAGLLHKGTRRAGGRAGSALG